MGGWQDGDPAGRRQFADLGPLTTERGQELPGVRVAFETWGTPRVGPDGSVANAVLVLHALTGDSHVTGPAGPGHPSPGWWDGLVGPSRAIDTDRWYVVAPNVLGGCQGTTGPASPAPDGRSWGSRFPALTVRDQVAAEARLAEQLGVRRWALVTGGSMGGMRALEWAVTWPDRVARLLLAASNAAATGDQIAWCAAQLAAIRADPAWQGGDYARSGPRPWGPVDGLGVARRIAHATYRSRVELDTRFGRQAQPGEDPAGGGRYAVESYLDHQAAKLVARFDAGSYVTLTEAMNSHDVGRGRGGTRAALARVSARTVVVGVDSDRLYPLEQQQAVADAVPGARPVRVVRSVHGHDGFLVETTAMAGTIAEALGSGPAVPTGREPPDLARPSHGGAGRTSVAAATGCLAGG